LITIIASCQIVAGNSVSWPNNKKWGEKDEKKSCRLNPYPIVSMVTINPNFKYGFYEDHIFANLVSPFAPST
jgi:hypothetical protein